MQQIQKYLEDFRKISLDKIDSIKLMKRHDMKYVFHKDKLQSIFNYLYNDYQVLEIERNITFRYDNLYYDTDDYFFYYQHHNQKLNRYKLRCRRYNETKNCYFEIKFKTNKSKTIKTRILLNNKEINNELPKEAKEFARKTIAVNNGKIIDRVSPALWVGFNRITFANLINKERLTFDMNLTYTDKTSNTNKINNLIIAELKSDKISINSPFSKFLKGLNISPSNFSKYSMGIAITEKDIKSNRFKEKLKKLKTLI